MKLPSAFRPGTDLRLALQLLKHALTQPRRAHHRLNSENAQTWWRMRRIIVDCNICGHRGSLLFEWPDLVTLRRHRIGTLRETTRCRFCMSKMRDRTVAAALIDLMRERYGIGDAYSISLLADRLPPYVRVLDTDANGRIAQRLGSHRGFTASLFDPTREAGRTIRPGVFNVDLQSMPFDDGAFDVVITSEVMEHVRFPERAHAEIARRLAAGGTYIFTVPYDETLSETWHLIDAETDRELVHPPHMHGDDPSLREGGIKSYRVFGPDLFDDLRRCGLQSAFERVQRPEVGVFGGDIFTARRVTE